MPTTLIRLESSGDPTIGGFAISFPSGISKTVSWRSESAINPTLDAAKDYSARVLQCCLDERRIEDADSTNWASVTAAVQRILADFNDRLPGPRH